LPKKQGYTGYEFSEVKKQGRGSLLKALVPNNIKYSAIFQRAGREGGAGQFISKLRGDGVG
jgi:hypothetical protein